MKTKAKKKTGRTTHRAPGRRAGEKTLVEQKARGDLQAKEAVGPINRRHLGEAQNQLDDLEQTPERDAASDEVSAAQEALEEAQGSFEKLVKKLPTETQRVLAREGIDSEGKLARHCLHKRWLADQVNAARAAAAILICLLIAAPAAAYATPDAGTPSPGVCDRKQGLIQALKCDAKAQCPQGLTCRALVSKRRPGATLSLCFFQDEQRKGKFKPACVRPPHAESGTTIDPRKTEADAEAPSEAAPEAPVIQTMGIELDPGDLARGGQPKWMQLVQALYTNARVGNVALLLALGVVALVALIRTFLVKRVPWLSTRRAGVLLTLAIAAAASLANALGAGYTAPAELVEALVQGAKVAVVSSGGWLVVRNLIFGDPSPVELQVKAAQLKGGTLWGNPLSADDPRRLYP